MPLQALNRPALILIIDDSVDTIKLLSGMLKDLGEIIFATNGSNGIELAIKRQPDLILLDVEMPDMDGYETCQKLISEMGLQHSAIMFVTAHASMESEVRALNAGAADFVSKPLNPPVVRARVQTQIRLKQHSNAILRLANLDGLTGIHNRRFFEQQLETEYQRHHRQQSPLALVLIDVDFFKLYNDSYGHLQGDACLRQVATAIDEATNRPGETVARYGGEEFVAILPHTDENEAKKYGQHICEIVRALKIVHSHSLVADIVTISVGLTSRIPGTGNISSQPQEMLGIADKALYEAKSAGRNQAIFLSQ